MRSDGAEVARKVGVQVVATSMGLVAGGPVGALLSAAATPVVELMLLRRHHSVHRMEHLLDLVEELSGVSPDELAAWAQQTEERLFLASAALQAAADARSETKLRALAKVLTDNLTDDARLDMAALTIAGLAELDPPHIKVLHTLVHHTSPDVRLNAHDDPGWTCVALKDRLPGLAEGIMPIIGTLTRAGMVTEADSSTNQRLAWVPTRYGVTCVNYLSDLS